MTEIITNLVELINLERVSIIEENEDSFIVEYKDSKHKVTKSDETYFRLPLPMSGPAMGLSLQMTQELELSLPSGIYQDVDTPKEFYEVMIFHELREMEYASNGFEDAHQRAVNDEIMYTFKFFDEETREKYAVFVEEYRSNIGHGSNIEDYVSLPDELTLEAHTHLMIRDKLKSNRNIENSVQYEIEEPGKLIFEGIKTKSKRGINVGPESTKFSARCIGEILWYQEQDIRVEVKEFVGDGNNYVQGEVSKPGLSLLSQKYIFKMEDVDFIVGRTKNKTLQVIPVSEEYKKKITPTAIQTAKKDLMVRLGL